MRLLLSRSTLVVVLVLSCTRCSVFSKDLPANAVYEDAKSLRETLKSECWNRLRRYRSLIDSNQPEEAEDALRDAISIAPWIPEPYAMLAMHLLDYGPPSKYIQESISLFRRAMRSQHKLPTAMRNMTASSLMKEIHKRPSLRPHFRGDTFPARLKHDREQLAFLGERGRLPQSVVERYVKGYDELLAMIPDAHLLHIMTLPENLWARTIGSVYQRALYVPEMEALQGPALNPKLDFAAIEEHYLSNKPSFTTIDNLLTQQALLGLRTYYQEATIFWDDKPGYVGAYVADGGFGNPIIAQLIEELIHAFPRIICSHRLNQAWAYKYDSEIQQPINIHADLASVNFNFWVSPDQGSLDKESGGLVVYTVSPPEGTPLTVFNHVPLHEDVNKMLAESNYENHTVPFLSNRAVIFQSDLFHKSGDMKWAPAYHNRRINLTLLFGKMYDKCKAVTEQNIESSDIHGEL